MNLPTPHQLSESPELGVLALLDFALDLAVRELVAVHPLLIADDPPYWLRDDSPPGHAARLMLPTIHQLQDSLKEYRRLEELDVVEDDIPF